MKKTTRRANSIHFSDIAHVPVTSPDGTRLTGFSTGGGPGPTIVLCNSMLGGVDAWRELIEAFAPLHRIVGWQYRGIKTAAKNVSIAQHATDLFSVLDAMQVDSAVLVGWSAGSRVAMEAVSIAPDRFLGVTLVCGVLQRPLRRLVEPVAGPFAALAPALGNLAAEIAPYAPSLWNVVGLGARSRTVHDLLRLIGAVSNSVPHQRLGELLADTTSLPLKRVMQMVRAIDRHVVDHAADQPDIPTLIIGGSADPLCPRGDVQWLANRWNRAETMIVPSAGHLLPVEFAELFALRLEKFIRTNTGFDALAASA